MEEDEEEEILYDIEELIQWPKTKENLHLDNSNQSSQYLGITGTVATVSNWGYSTLKAIGLPVKQRHPCVLQEALVKLVNSRDSWIFALSNDGRFVAILQEAILEVREIRESSTPVIGRCIFDQDIHPQWRKVKWNDDATLVTFSTSFGDVYVCDLKGIIVCKIEGKSEFTHLEFDRSNAVCGLAFINDKKHSIIKLLVLKHNGNLTCYEINGDEENGYQFLNDLNISGSYKFGVTDIIYDPNHDMIVVAGCSGLPSSSTAPKYKKVGLNAWRILSDYPHYKEISLRSNSRSFRNRPGLLRRLSTVPENISLRLKGQTTDGIFCISISPDGGKLIAVHLSGHLSVWEIPSLRQEKMWLHEQQPHFAETDPNSTADKIKLLKEYPMLHNIISCSWWNEHSVILARCSGNLTIVNTSKYDLTNLLGKQCEWLEPASNISPAINDMFLSLECSTKTKSLKRQIARNENGEDTFDPFLDNSDNEEDNDGMLKKITNYSKGVLWNLTEYEYFQPPRKRPKVVTKIHTLVSLMKTTPENLFNRKIELEEYGSALSLAESYGLDSDRVYQRQWEKSIVSKASIQDYLSKIKKTEWVLKECCERVPADLDAAKELIRFGLAITDLKQISEIGSFQNLESGDSSDDEENLEEEEYQGFNVEEQKKQERCNREIYVKRWSKSIDLNNLNLFQDNMLRCRRKLLKYSDRVCTLEELLGGYDAARERYDPNMFSNFRKQSMLEITLNYARKCDWNSVETCFTFHYDELKEHRLVILSNFPETAMPNSYTHLLPCLDSNGIDVEACTTYNHRSFVDWSEDAKLFKEFKEVEYDYVNEIYEENECYTKFRAEHITKDICEKWYSSRACSLEEDARNIEGCLQLLKHAMAHGFPGVGELRKEIGILGTLIYECNWDVGLTLKELQTKSNLQKLEMLLQTSTPEMFIKNVHRWAIPFLKGCGDSKYSYDLWNEYFVSIAVNDITFPCLALQASMPGKSVTPIIGTKDQRKSITVNCLYEMTDSAQLYLAQDMCDCIYDEQDIEVVSLNKQLHACKVMAKQDVKILPVQIKDIEKNRKQVNKLFIRMSRSAANRQPALKESDWNELLDDMIELRNSLFSQTCGLEAAVCLEVFVESLLTSGVLANLKIAAKRMMTSVDEEHSVSTFNHPKTVTQKLSYESAINLVIKSAQEFFDASSPTADNQMLSIARECLLLITDNPPQIQEFLDLIEGVVLLQHFHVGKLPLQVRLMTSRLSLIEEALNKADNVYKKTDALLRLGMLLRVFGSNEKKRKGTILIKIVERALHMSDYATALFLCKELVEESYKDAWNVCLQLVKVDEIECDYDKKIILNFVVCYCDENELPSVMKHMNIITARIIKQQLEEVNAEEISEFEMAVDNLEFETDDQSMNDVAQSGDHQNTPEKTSMFSAHNVLSSTARGTKNVISLTGHLLSATGHTTASVISNTTNKTKAMLSNMQDSLWLKNTVTSTINTLTNATEDEVDKVFIKKIEPFKKQLFDEFYDEISTPNLPKFGMNISEFSYVIPKEVVLRHTKLRLLVLNKMLNQNEESEDEIFTDLIREILPVDYSWGIGYLLSINNYENTEACFNYLPITALSLQLCVYFYSIQLLSSIYNVEPKNYIAPHYCDRPVIVMEKAVDIASSLDEYDSISENTTTIAQYLMSWKGKLNDYIQAEKLNDLGRGINLPRFTNDAEYRDETVVGLSMTEDIEQYKLAVSLAERYNADVWEILMTHLEFLFTDCDSLETTDIKDRIDKLQMIPELSSRPADFFNRLDNNIYPLIEGTDYDKLLLYFYLLNQCGEEISQCISKHNLCTMTPAFHVKTLKKIKATCPSLNYKKIVIDVKEDETDTMFFDRILSVLTPVLNLQSLPMFAKLMPSIPYSTSSITNSLLSSYVAEISMKPHIEIDGAELAWAKKYEKCNVLLHQLTPDHLLKFADKVLFSEEHINSIPHSSRKDMAKSLLKLVRNQAATYKKGKLDISLQGEHFSNIVPVLQQMSRHLDSYSTNFITDLFKSREKDEKKAKYFCLYEKSQGKPESILQLAVTILEDGGSSNSIKKLFAVTPGNKWKLPDVLQSSISSMFKISKSATVIPEDVMQRVDGIVTSVSQDEKDNIAGCLSSQDVVAQLRPICENSTVPVNIRVDILSLLEEKFNLEESEVDLLLYNRTSVIITSQWDIGNMDCNLTNVSDETCRYEVFMHLIATKDIAPKQLDALVSLLKMWPEFSSKSKFIEVWAQTLKLLCGSIDGSKIILDLLKSTPGINQKTILSPAIELIKKNKFILSCLKIILISNDKLLYDQVPDIMGTVETVGPGICDYELLQLLLDKEIAHSTIGTKFYSCLVEFLLSEECENAEILVENLVKKLQDMGHVAEAGTLLLNFKGSHPSVRTFGTAMSYLTRWLQR